MLEIIALFSVLNPCISETTICQFCQIVFALLAMTGRTTMLNISRWTSKPAASTEQSDNTNKTATSKRGRPKRSEIYS